MSTLATLILAPAVMAAQPVMPSPAPVALPVAASSAPVVAQTSVAAISWSLPASAAVASVQTEGPETAAETPQGAEQEEVQPQTPPEEPPQSDEAADNTIVVTGDYGPPKEDPLMRVNERAFDVVDGVDQAVVGPIAYAYEDALPSPIRDASRNVLQNLREPVNFVNFLLQFKFGKAVETLGRFAINSTLGLGGIIDVAGKEGIGLPYRRNGFSDTMGFYGVGDGPFLVLPFIGSTTLRDLVGSGLDQSVLPYIAGKPFNSLEYGIPAYAFNSLNSRLEFDEQLKDIRDGDDPYVQFRTEYLEKRQFEIDLLKTGDNRAGIPGAYLRYKRERDAALKAGTTPPPAPGEEPEAIIEAAPEQSAEKPETSAAATIAPAPHIAADADIILTSPAPVTENGDIAMRHCTLDAPCQMDRPQFARVMLYPVS
ncbi:MAG: MlaA family lipoprotein [Marinomonas sp.]